MNRLSSEKRRTIVAALVEGNGINATARMAGVSKNTVLKLLTDLGLVCSIYQDRLMRDLPCERVQADEIWSFCGMKEKNVPADKKGQTGYGDVWTWVALDPDTKIVITYLVGGRGMTEAKQFALDLRSRLRNRVQLTTDGYANYLPAIREAFGRDVDYAMLVKSYGAGDPVRAGARYSPGVCTGIETQVVSGSPDPAHISTSYIERQNLGIRMNVRRFTRLTNAFSKKIENHTAAISLHFFTHNFVRVHGTLKTTPAVAAGITDHVWDLSELIGLLEQAEKVPTRRGTYKKRQQGIPAAP